MAFGSWAARIPEIADRIGVDIAGLGLTLLMGGVGGVIGTRTAGAAIDRFGGKSAAIAGSVAVSLLLPLIGLATNPIMLGIALFLIGIADLSADLGMNALAMAPEAESSRFINRFHGLWSVGTFVGGGIATAFASASVPLLVHFAGIGIVLTLLALAVRRFTVSTPPIPHPAPSGSRSNLRPLVVLGLLGFSAASLESPGADWSAILLAEGRGATPAVAALGFVAFATGMTLARLTGDAVVARLRGKQANVGALILSLIGWLTATTQGATSLTLVGLGVAGLGIGILFPQLYADGARGESVSPGRGLAAMSLGARIGFLVSAPLIGTLGTLLSLEIALAIVAIVSVSGSLLLTLRG